MHRTPLILASASPSRRQLLNSLRIPFSVVVSHEDETPHPNEAIEAMVMRLAEAKARAVQAKHPNAIIIGCDQVGAHPDIRLDKPLTHERAVQQLKACSGQTIPFYSALCVLAPQGQSPEKQSSCVITHVRYRSLDDASITAYLTATKPYQCAGSIQMEGPGIGLLERIESEDPNALMGLPLIRLTHYLRALNHDPLLLDRTATP